MDILRKIQHALNEIPNQKYRSREGNLTDTYELAVELNDYILEIKKYSNT
jgi:hypothetical protein